MHIYRTIMSVNSYIWLRKLETQLNRKRDYQKINQIADHPLQYT